MQYSERQVITHYRDTYQNANRRVTTRKNLNLSHTPVGYPCTWNFSANSLSFVQSTAANAELTYKRNKQRYIDQSIHVGSHTSPICTKLRKTSPGNTALDNCALETS